MHSSTNNMHAGLVEGADLLKFRCGECGTCCHLWIPVTDDDVRRLMAGTGLPAWQIVEFVRPSMFGSNPEMVAWIKLGPRRQDRRVMCLREIRDRCRFLRANRCSVYEHRPLTCREHPFVLSMDESERKIESIELNDVSVCSYTLDGKVRKRDLKRIYRWNVREDESYFEKVRRWNRHTSFGTELDFLHYLGLNE